MINQRLRYDPLTGIIVWKNGRRRGCEAGTIGTRGYRLIKVEGRILRAHRVAWFLFHGEWPAQLDHRDGNILNNRIENLRLATSSDNRANARPQSKIGIRGIFYEAGRGKYKVQIYKHRRHLFVGRFADLDKAIEAAAKASRDLHGGFAYVNRSLFL